MAAQPSEPANSYAGVPRERIARYPTIAPERCLPEGCQLECMKACPQEVYARQEDGRVIVAWPFLCTVGDISCSYQCPLDAISFPSKRDLRRMLEQARSEIQT